MHFSGLFPAILKIHIAWYGIYAFSLQQSLNTYMHNISSMLPYLLVQAEGIYKRGMVSVFERYISFKNNNINQNSSELRKKLSYQMSLIKHHMKPHDTT